MVAFLIMDQESIVYGCIKDAIALRGDQQRRKINRDAMMLLPSSEDWSYLSREMFSLPSDIWGGVDQYQSQVMHFGASYRAIEYEWKGWISKFENLLDQMYWVSAIVHLETELSGIHTFTWESKNSWHQPGAGIDTVHCQWVHEGNLT